MNIKEILKFSFFILAFFPAVKCLVTIMELTHIWGAKFGNTSMLDYAIQIIGLTYFIYYLSLKKN